MKKKRIYRIRNWKEYNKALIKRGNITIWVSEDAIGKWLAKESKGIGRSLTDTLKNESLRQ